MYYAAKGKTMADDAKCGLMLWDGESKGTLNNIQNLLGSGKKILVYFSPKTSFHEIVTSDDLSSLLPRCSPELIAAVHRRIEKVASVEQLLLQPSLVAWT